MCKSLCFSLHLHGQCSLHAVVNAFQVLVFTKVIEGQDFIATFETLCCDCTHTLWSLLAAFVSPVTTQQSNQVIPKQSALYSMHFGQIFFQISITSKFESIIIELRLDYDMPTLHSSFRSYFPRWCFWQNLLTFCSQHTAGKKEERQEKKKKIVWFCCVFCYCRWSLEFLSHTGFNTPLQTASILCCQSGGGFNQQARHEWATHSKYVMAWWKVLEMTNTDEKYCMVVSIGWHTCRPTHTRSTHFTGLGKYEKQLNWN